jgi:hypothetical protein
MFNPELVGVLCEKVSSETDPRKLHELNALLQAVIKEDVEEIRLDWFFSPKGGGLGLTWTITATWKEAHYPSDR